MKRVLFGLVGLGVLAFLYWTISPLFITKRVLEQSPQTPTASVKLSSSNVSYQGSFVSGFVGHQAAGQVKVYMNSNETLIRFEEDFKVTNGPDLYVYLGQADKYDPSAQIAKLKGNQGSQNYQLPTNLDIKNYSTVWIWCKAFSVPFGKAILQQI